MEVLERIKDRIIYGEVPTPWDKWKKTLLERRFRGLVMADAPRTFYIGRGLSETFDELLPVKGGRLDTSRITGPVNRALHGLESYRALVSGPNGDRFLVRAIDDSTPVIEANASGVTNKRLDNQFGSIHTHPEDGMPSMTDVRNLLDLSLFLEIIVSPARVIALLRTTNTPTFPLKAIAEGYLTGMGVKKGKITQFNDFYAEVSAKFSGRSFVHNVWSLDYGDLKELGILGYEARRGHKVFVLQN